MYRITNKNKSPVQLVIKSKKHGPREFTVLNIPGVGKGKNIYFLEDERMTEYVERAKNDKLILIDYVKNKKDI